jgi:hypothetical protein
MTSTFFPSSARAAPRLTAVVLLPTPPFWLATAMIRASTFASRAVRSATVDRSSLGLRGESLLIAARCAPFEADLEDAGAARGVVRSATSAS